LAKPRPISITPKNLRELQKAMKRMETAIEPKDVRPILAHALIPFKEKALEILRRLTKRSKNLPPGWEHIEDAFEIKEGRSNTVARAFAKVFRRASPQAIWIEFGHRMVGHRPGKKDTGKYVTANPFFRPALNITRTEIQKCVRDGVKALLLIEANRSGFKGKG
jgi:hypothetical protein